MGHWEQPDHEVYRKAADALTSLSSLVLQDDLNELLTIMDKAGLIVRKDYYVPDVDELYGLMRQLTYGIDVPRDGWRWVMCRETVDALARKYDRQMAPKPIKFDASWWKANDDMPSAALQMEVDQVIESRRYWPRQDRLFGVDIRIDPAARRPMFEIDDEKLKPAAAKVPIVERNEP